MYPPIDSIAIDRAVSTLESGGLVAIPTETVYGLAADADNREAVLRTFAVKGRPTNHPLIVHVHCAQALYAWARTVPAEALTLAQAFWPGPLTMVLPKSERCGLFVTGGQDSVALRCPSHPWIHELLTRFAGSTYRGLTAPSANTFGHISPTSAQHVREDLGVKPLGKLDAILDGGECEIGVESTIINLSGARPEILRYGAVTREMLEQVLGVAVPEAGTDAPRASGRLKSHYAPQTKLELVAPQNLHQRLIELAGARVALMSRLPVTVTAALPQVVFACAAADTPQAYAHSLYAQLHALDALGADRIVIEQPPQNADWAAVNDRLGRAAADKS